MTTLAIVAVILALMTMGFIFKNGVLLLASSLGWVIFAFLMFNKAFSNEALSTGLLMFGGALAIITAVTALNIFMSGRPEKVDRDLIEQENYRRQVINATRRH